MAQAILLKEVEGLGTAGEAVDVSPGYLRNYLVPRKLAQPATKGALEEAERTREAAEKAEREALERAGETAALLSKTVLTINHRAGEDGKLFGSVTAKEIAEAISEARGLRIEKKRIRLDEPIRALGTYMVEVEIAGGATATVKTIVAEQSSSTARRPHRALRHRSPDFGACGRAARGSRKPLIRGRDKHRKYPLHGWRSRRHVIPL